MSDEKFREFQTWWADDQQSELRQSCAEGWAYAIWQASRESLVVELPAENPLGNGPGDCEGGLPSFEQHCAAECNFILRDCREAIESLGLRVKP